MVVAALLTAVERNRRYDKRIVSDKRRRMYKIIQEYDGTHQKANRYISRALRNMMW